MVMRGRHEATIEADRERWFLVRVSALRVAFEIHEPKMHFENTPADDLSQDKK
jgi:hypothetical protein